MKHILLLISLSLACYSCTKDFGDAVTKEFPVSGTYSAIEVHNGFSVTLSDEVTAPVITVGEKAMDRVVVKVKNSVLIIDFKWGTNYSGTASVVLPSNITLNEVTLSGGSTFTGGELYGAEAELHLSGGSVFTGTADVTELDMVLSGGSVATLSGSSTNSMDMKLSGGSEVHAYELMTPEVDGEMSGGSIAYVTCCTALEVDLSGGSQLSYGLTDVSCRPVVDCTTSGGSTVSPKN